MKIDIQWKMVTISALLMIFVFIKTSFAQQKFDKAAFYDVMASGDMDAINTEINIVEDASLNNKEGYEGALLIRKAGFVTPAKKKLKYFKEGRIKLEMALIADSENTEFHFLRLTIEENAPKIVKYHADIEKDKLFVQTHFQNLSPSVKQAILNYCKKSKILHAEDFSVGS
ncbi:MAG TPA: hypothetical protein DCO83_04065 [Mucilaginibacter sp.]|jgi:hypothetical protein|nr:hypothetical protein [Mucilaginibacter sp.]